jgi:hypothetical protein
MKVVTHAQFRIAHDERDVVWIPKVAAAGHIILTKDKNIRRDTLEARVVVQAGAYYFTLGRGSRTAEQNAAIILHHRRTIEELIHENPGPLIAQINAGEVMLRDETDRSLKRVARRRTAGT